MADKNFLTEIIDADLAEGKISEIHTRFPPEPNGYLHIGSAKAIYINWSIANQYGGKFNLRLDDTNPAREGEEYVNSIIEDLHWLGADPNGGIFYGSDYFDKCYEYAEKLILEGKAYVDDLTRDEMREYRGSDAGKPSRPSPWRDRTPEENLDLFRRMRAGEFKEGEKTLRAKIDLASPNMNMRDPAIYRIKYAEHHRQGNKWCIYPMYDFAHPIQDAIEGITHSMCSLEFENHRPLYNWVVEHCDLPAKPRQIEFARLGIDHTVMSKRKLRRLVEEGKEHGYVTTMFGRRRPVPELSSKNFMQRSFGERVAMNSPIQGTAADIIKIAMNRVDRRLRREGLKSRIVLQVHDELLIETWKEELDTVRTVLSEEMKHAADLKVSLESDMKTGNSWFETK